jgi:hypothetical protein
VSDRNRAGDALRKGYACLVNNHCWRSLDYFEEGCVKTDCGSQAQAVISALAHAADDVNNLLGACAGESFGDLPLILEIVSLTHPTTHSLTRSLAENRPPQHEQRRRAHRCLRRCHAGRHCARALSD